jgi:hypothetical protein
MPGLSGRRYLSKNRVFIMNLMKPTRRHGSWCYMKMDMPLAAAGSLHQTIRMCIYWAAWPYGNPAAADSTGSAWYGKRLVREAEGWLRGRHVKRLALSAQVRVRPFYEKLGYTASGDEYLDEYCPHIHMEKELTE